MITTTTITVTTTAITTTATTTRGILVLLATFLMLEQFRDGLELGVCSGCSQKSLLSWRLADGKSKGTVSHGWDGGQVHIIWSSLAETENAFPKILLLLISDFQCIVESMGFVGCTAT